MKNAVSEKRGENNEANRIRLSRAVNIAFQKEKDAARCPARRTIALCQRLERACWESQPAQYRDRDEQGGQGKPRPDQLAKDRFAIVQAVGKDSHSVTGLPDFNLFATMYASIPIRGHVTKMEIPPVKTARTIAPSKNTTPLAT